MGKYMRNGKGVEKMQEVSHFCHGHGSSLGVRTRARAALAALHEKENAIAHGMVTDSSGTHRSSSANSSVNLHHARRTENSYKTTASAMAASSSSPRSIDDEDPRNQTCIHRMELRSCRKLRAQKPISNLIRPKCVRSNSGDGAAEVSRDETRIDSSQAQKIIKRSNVRGGSANVSSSMEASAAEAKHHGRSFRVLRQMRSSSANSAAGVRSDGRASLGRKKGGQELDLHIHIPRNLSSTTHGKKANLESNLSVVNPPPSPSPSIQCSVVSSPERRLGNVRRPLGVLTRYRRQVLSSNIAGQEEADNHAATVSPVSPIHFHPDHDGSLNRAPVDHIEIEPCCGESPSMVAVGSLAAIARARRHVMNNNIQTRDHQRITAENSNSVQKRSDREEEEYSCSIAEAPDIMDPCIPEAPGSTTKKMPYKSNIRSNCFDDPYAASPSPSPSPVSSACFAANNNNNDNNGNNSNARPRSAPPFSRTSNGNYRNVRECPSSGEIEAFLANAEQQQRRRFMDRYNFDPLREKAFRGRYEWQKLID